jgi:hypothetical protein
MGAKISNLLSVPWSCVMSTLTCNVGKKAIIFLGFETPLSLSLFPVEIQVWWEARGCTEETCGQMGWGEGGAAMVRSLTKTPGC